MTVVSIGGHLHSPPLPNSPDGSLIKGSFLLDAADEELSFICQIPKTGTIRKLHWVIQTVTTAGDVIFRIETVDTDGTPTGTLIHPSATKQQTVSGSFQEWDIGVSTAAAVTQGDKVAVMVKADSTSVPNISLAVIIGKGGGDEVGFPYLYHTDGGNKQNHAPMMCLEYDDATIEPIVGTWAVHDVGKSSWTGTSEWRGLRIELEHTARVAGVWWMGYGSAAGGAVLELFDSDGAAFSTPMTYTVDFDDSKSQSASKLHFHMFSSKETLSANTTYRAALKPTSGTVNLEFVEQITLQEAKWDGVQGGGQEVYWTGSIVGTPTAPGDWTDVTTKRPVMGLIIDGLEDGVGLSNRPLAPSRRRHTYTMQARRPKRSPVISSLPAPAVEIVPIRARRKQVVQVQRVRRAVPTTADSTTVNLTAVVASYRRVR